MRRVSKKRRKLNDSVANWRDSFRKRVGRCEKCLKKADPDVLDVHELVPGSSRAKALDKPFAVLALHRGCHNYIETLTIPHQLAYLMRARPNDYRPDLYYALIGRNWPDTEHVIYFLKRLKEVE